MKKYSIIILILCSWAMSLFAISCSDQESKPQPFLGIFWKYQKSSTKYAYNQLIINLPTFIEEQIGNKNGN